MGTKTCMGIPSCMPPSPARVRVRKLWVCFGGLPAYPTPSGPSAASPPQPLARRSAAAPVPAPAALHTRTDSCPGTVAGHMSEGLSQGPPRCTPAVLPPPPLQVSLPAQHPLQDLGASPPVGGSHLQAETKLKLPHGNLSPLGSPAPDVGFH